MVNDYELLLQDHLQRIQTDIEQLNDLICKMDNSLLYVSESQKNGNDGYTVDDYKKAKQQLKRLEKDKKRIEEYIM